MKQLLLILFMWLPLSSNQQPVDIDTITQVEPPSKRLAKYSDVIQFESDVRELALRQDTALRERAKTDRVIRSYVNSEQYKEFIENISE